MAGHGGRALTRGGAQVSEKHCNFLINVDNATAADLEGLGEEVRRRVFAASGITLVKVQGWYDNEWGYANRLVDLSLVVGAGA